MRSVRFFTVAVDRDVGGADLETDVDTVRGEMVAGGMRSLVRLAARIAATRAVASASPSAAPPEEIGVTTSAVVRESRQPPRACV